MNTVAIGVRFTRVDWERYSASAQARGLTLGAYLRQIIDEHERGSTAVAEIRALLERRYGNTKDNGPAALRAALLEILLILRQGAGPQRAGIARKEVERQGLEPW